MENKVKKVNKKTQMNNKIDYDLDQENELLEKYRNEADYEEKAFDKMMNNVGIQCPELCDWCVSEPVSFEDEAFSLCERCAEQYMGD